ncbi:hypothetical protein NPIL_422581 [Nephila pilipes]|uniref:Uncharacterized protein n=1 Tax=Nephila pilipes TaxID=299642 RepID=A0A8X6QQ16_NEPPI|nr:hypothetical protein NPIL_422581 [Nephila pilipes]
MLRPTRRSKYPKGGVKRNGMEHPKKEKKKEASSARMKKLGFFILFFFCLQIVNDRCICRPYPAIRDALIYGGSCVYTLPLNASAS